MPKHIELNRTFLPFTQEGNFDPDYLRAQARFGLSVLTWTDLLALYRVVILAEAGTGKTHEMQAQTEQLRGDGRQAFFIPIEDLAQGRFEEALLIGQPQEYHDWLGSDSPAWFFLDSVDEARLSHPRNFEKAIRRFARSLGPSSNRAHVYISSRVSDWRATSDFRLVEDLLPHVTVQKIDENEEQRDKELPSTDDETPAGSETQTEIKIVQLAPLDLDQMKRFAAGHQMAEVNMFIDAIQRNDAGIFAERPQDLLELIAYWAEHQRIGTHAEMIAFNIERKLQETNLDRQAPPLSMTTACKGVELLSAAVTFTKKSSIRLPDQSNDPERTQHALDPKKLFMSPDWDDQSLQTLISRALFDEATYGRVRFHHRSVREYLTARWIRHLLDKHKPRRAIERLLFAEKYGLEVMVPSLKPIAAWLALWDDRIRNTIFQRDPGCLIEYGDPAKLPIETKDSLLRQFVLRCMEQKTPTSSLENVSIRRLADPNLGSTVLELLEQYSESREIRDLMLRIIWQGELVECADSALSLVLDAATDSISRVYAIRAVEAAGSEKQKKQIAEVVRGGINEWDQRSVGAALDCCFPDYLIVDDLLSILASINPPAEYSSSLLKHSIEKAIHSDLKLKEQEAWLTGLVQLLESEPHIEKRFCEVSERYSWLLSYAAQLAEKIVQKIRERAEGFPYAVLRTIELMAQGKFYQDEYLADNELDRCIDELAVLRRELFWMAVSRKRKEVSAEGGRLDDIWPILFDPNISKLKAEDFPSFLSDLEFRAALDDRLIALSTAFFLWKQDGSKQEGLDQLWKAVQGESALESRLHSLLHPPPDSEKESQLRRREQELTKRKNEEQAQKERQKQEWIVRLQRNPDCLRRIQKESIDTVFPDLFTIVRGLMRRVEKENHSMRWGTSRWDLLIPKFGREVAEAARDGLMDFWRLYEPPLRSERNSNGVPNGLIAGLTGLWIESRECPGWAERLSNVEARLACRYAFCEMNGFPDWAVDLLNHHPETFDGVLQEELSWEFDLPSDKPAPHYVISALHHGPETIRTRYRPGVLSLLSRHEPAQAQTLESALSVLLTWEDLDHKAFAILAETRWNASQDEKRCLTWLAALMCVDAKVGLGKLFEWIDMAGDASEARKRMILFCNSLINFRDVRFNSIWRDFERVEVLTELLPKIYSLVRVEEDQFYEGVYSPNDRDNAQSVRGYLLDRLYQTPGQETFDALIAVSHKIANQNTKQRIIQLAHQRAALDAELPPWILEDVRHFSEYGEKEPNTAHDLFQSALDRLDDIKYELEEGDESEAVILRDVKYETDLRTWLASRLRLSASGNYSIISEQELADATRTDLRFYSQAVDAPVTIELKIADKLPYTLLEERLCNQLVGQYLRDPRSYYGIYLLARCYRNSWQNIRKKKDVDFKGLVEELQREADAIIADKPDVLAIKVMGIDLSKRCGTK